MPTEILPVASGAANSSDLVLADGESMNLLLEGAAFDARANIAIKGATGAYVVVDGITQDVPAVNVIGPATYRVSRVGTAACGVSRD